MAKKPIATPLKVGFDLDGVLLYNPARTIRPVVTFVKRRIFKRHKTTFYFPKGRWRQALFRLFHKTSFMTAPGLETLRILTREGKIEAYLITARFDFLKKDLDHWLNKINADEIFTGIYHNANNEQPHQFKQKMLQKLNLDLYVEDNWDIVRHLAQSSPQSTTKATQIVWISNLLDMHRIDYPYKFLTLRDAVYHIIRQLNR